MPIAPNEVDERPPHPAKFSAGIVERMAILLVDHPGCVLDPFAGTGRIHQLSDMGNWCTHGVEIEEEWAAYHERTIVGDARELPFGDNSFDAVACSPTYANGMGQPKPYANNSGGIRHSYADRLGRELSEGNTGRFRWAQQYRDLHEAAWSEVARVLKPNGRFLMNFKDPFSKGRLLPVSGWHTDMLRQYGLVLQGSIPVPTKGMTQGQHLDKLKIDGEIIHVYDLVENADIPDNDEQRV